MVGFRQEFHAARGRKPPKAGQDLRRVLLELFQGDPGCAERDAESSRIV
jgi:hypothetical protein